MIVWSKTTLLRLVCEAVHVLCALSSWRYLQVDWTQPIGDLLTTASCICWVILFFLHLSGKCSRQNQVKRLRGTWRTRKNVVSRNLPARKLPVSVVYLRVRVFRQIFVCVFDILKQSSNARYAHSHFKLRSNFISSLQSTLGLALLLSTKVRAYAYYILSYVKIPMYDSKNKIRVWYAYYIMTHWQSNLTLCGFQKADLDELNNRLLLYTVVSYSHNAQSVIMLDFVWAHVIKV